MVASSEPWNGMKRANCISDKEKVQRCTYNGDKSGAVGRRTFEGNLKLASEGRKRTRVIPDSRQHQDSANPINGLPSIREQSSITGNRQDLVYVVW